LFREQLRDPVPLLSESDFWQGGPMPVWKSSNWRGRSPHQLSESFQREQSRATFGVITDWGTGALGNADPLLAGRVHQGRNQFLLDFVGWTGVIIFPGNQKFYVTSRSTRLGHKPCCN
jgi:hypothetical protein